VPVRAEAEEDEVEALGQLRLGRAEGVDLLLGDGDAGEERLAGEALVRVRVLGRHEALVAPPDVPGVPVEGKLREALVDAAGRRAAGERDAEGRASASSLGDPAGRELG
jgi:hypothetical protein